MESYAVGTTFKATEKLTFPVLYSDHPNYPYKKEWLLWTKIAEQNNVVLEPTIVPLSDYQQKRSLLVSSGDAPLIMPKTYPGQETPFVSSGAILAVSDYVDKMPNFTDKVAKWKLESEIDGLRQADGKFYLLPGLHEELWPDYTLCFRLDILEKEGIAIPTTWDEVHEVLKKLKSAYPDVTPYSDRYEGLNALGIAGTTYNTMAGWAFKNTPGLQFDKAGDKFNYAPAMTQYKDLLTYFNALVSEGLMDKESFTQKDDQAVEKFVNGKSFVISANSQDIVTYRTSMDKSIGAGKYKIGKITVPAGPAGNLKGGSRLENGIMLSAQAAKSPNFLAMLQFIDWLWYSDEGQEFCKWGVKGETFEKDGSGKRTLVSSVNYNGLNPKGTKDLRIDYGFSGGVFAYGGTTELLQSMMLPEEIEFQKAMEPKTPRDPAPPVPFSDLDREEVTLLQTPLGDYVNEQTLKFIIGSRPLSEFDAFVKELDGKGMGKYLEMSNAAYQEYKKNK